MTAVLIILAVVLLLVMAGSLFGITRPGRTIDFEQATDSSGKLLFNKDGSPTLLPKQQRDASGTPLYSVSGTAFVTPCAVGVGTTVTNCVGTSINTPATTPPFYERFVGDSARPRISVGFGVNWNSPFGPLRIDVAKTLVTVEGDDSKLITFNVGTQF
mgnify:CR=1 FL=1